MHARDGVYHSFSSEPVPEGLWVDSLRVLARRSVAGAAQEPVGSGEGGRWQDGHRQGREQEAAHQEQRNVDGLGEFLSACRCARSRPPPGEEHRVGWREGIWHDFEER